MVARADEVEPPSEAFEYCRLSVGEHQTPSRLVKQLIQFEYRRVDRVSDPGEFSLRGGMLEVFPATFESPLRLEFNGTRIHSIRSVNPQTLQTLDRHTMVVILPRRIHTKCSTDVPFEACVDLREGDYVVHIDHGVGRYLGKAKMAGTAGAKAFKAERSAEGPAGRCAKSAGAAGGVSTEAQDALLIEYADGDRLYVPMDQLHLVQKYAALGARAPSVHKLGGTAWERARTKAYVGAWTYAKTLVELEARRVAIPGYAYPSDHEWQRTFEEAFPYRETADQLTATEQVKRDLERPQPMDRLLLGDVGYGKTEVAIRAAFKVIMAHRQVAVLVPTTILAYQHYRTFTKRMQGFPIRVEMLSRFETASGQRHIIESLKAGTCDLVIGTHRLLSGDVRFKDLGLLVVDEEQRFGVKDKESLKQWSLHVDIMALSATPIPRTLYLALAGTRAMSLIMTPPEDRHPVHTELVEEDDQALRSWVYRELSRGGQVYFVHNRVQTIQQVARHLQQLVPEARVGVAHGQMAEQALEQVMIAFIEGQIDVLVTTTIIESGIDIPNANTLVVNRADRFGLADLYQLRGRVGRCTRGAYAYLRVPKRAILTAEARKRLEAITTHTALGSGFKIAMEDLKIRGAGNLLGIEQSGHISAVGFDLYCRLLRDAVSRLKQEEVGRN